MKACASAGRASCTDAPGTGILGALRAGGRRFRHLRPPRGPATRPGADGPPRRRTAMMAIERWVLERLGGVDGYGERGFYQEAVQAILDSDRATAEDVAQRALAAGLTPADIMQNGFVKGISEIGELFDSGEVFLPELMMAADAMAGATEVTNAALVSEGGAVEAKGKIVIGTVQGDVHDIGK
ncbi:MAG: hypothetical protein EHM52_02220, partial [Actinomycetota bacterium]